MALFSRHEQHLLSSVAQLGYGNPFLPERITFEKAALGREFVEGGEVWSASVSEPDAEPPNVTAIHRKLSALMEGLPARLAAGEVGGEEFAAYEESVHYLLYQRYHPQFVAAQGKWRFYRGTFWRIGTGFCASPASDWTAAWNRPTCLRVSGKCSGRFITSTTTS